MFIRLVDEGLEKLIRDALPMPEQLGDVSFEAPTSTWSAQLSRLTVNLFLYEVARSSQPTRTPINRVGADGRPQRRVSLPMVQLSYLVSAWAGSPRDEHQLLGDVINRLAGRTTLGPEHLSPQISSAVDLDLSDDPQNRSREIWTALGGHLKASVTLQVVVAADAFDWTEAAPAVRAIEALTSPIPAGSPI